MPNPTVSIEISSEIYAEFLFRKMDKKLNVARWIEDIVVDYLTRTEEQEGWSENYYEWKANSRVDDEFIEKYGDPAKGYHWQSVYLPNGTRLSMKYKGTTKYACVQNELICYENEVFSPATLARKIANNTSRNAWRDLYIRRPGDATWILADDIRRGRIPLTLDDL